MNHPYFEEVPMDHCDHHVDPHIHPHYPYPYVPQAPCCDETEGKLEVIHIRGVAQAKKVGNKLYVVSDGNGVADEKLVITANTDVARSLANRFADWINVKDYVAKGDGTTDDTQAFRDAAIVAKEKNGILFLPVGTYKITELPDVPMYGSGNVSYTDSTGTTIYKADELLFLTKGGITRDDTTGRFYVNFTDIDDNFLEPLSQKLDGDGLGISEDGIALKVNIDTGIKIIDDKLTLDDTVIVGLKKGTDNKYHLDGDELVQANEDDTFVKVLIHGLTVSTIDDIMNVLTGDMSEEGTDKVLENLTNNSSLEARKDTINKFIKEGNTSNLTEESTILLRNELINRINGLVVDSDGNAYIDINNLSTEQLYTLTKNNVTHTYLDNTLTASDKKVLFDQILEDLAMYIGQEQAITSSPAQKLTQAIIDTLKYSGKISQLIQPGGGLEISSEHQIKIA